MNKLLKYLLCILFSILAISFLVSISSFLANTDNYLMSASINANPKSEDVIEIGEKLEKELNKNINDLKKQNGDDYPALGIMYYKAITHYSSVRIIQNLIFSLIAGFAVGNIIFLIFISGLKQYKLTLALIGVLALTGLFMSFSDIYTAISNSEPIDFGIPNILWNIEVWTVPFIIVTVIMIIIRNVYSTYHEIRYSE